MQDINGVININPRSGQINAEVYVEQGVIHSLALGQSLKVGVMPSRCWSTLRSRYLKFHHLETRLSIVEFERIRFVSNAIVRCCFSLPQKNKIKHVKSITKVLNLNGKKMEVGRM